MQDLELPPERLLLDPGEPGVLHVSHGLVPQDSDKGAVVSYHIHCKLFLFLFLKIVLMTVSIQYCYHQYRGYDHLALPPTSWFWLLENTEIYPVK